MLRKSKSGDGYSLTIKISDKESQQITLFATVKNVTPAVAAKKVLFDNLRLTDSEKANLAKLVA